MNKTGLIRIIRETCPEPFDFAQDRPVEGFVVKIPITKAQKGKFFRVIRVIRG